ncbi:hypothetical protein ANCDUO_10856 [Ancylostoma duodenale]|uniref:Uncharacterized protein n=1 Tax=Ancylostoma duodenale TaxID=51022 RepID=A0A0C2CQA0_9BILA|nr:hypothetical protein ANCDUO_10856 [Ancylostoma duodenale]
MLNAALLTISVSKLKFLVLDEADMLLRDGRDSHLESILSDEKFPKVRIMHCDHNFLWKRQD